MRVKIRIVRCLHSGAICHGHAAPSAVESAKESMLPGGLGRQRTFERGKPLPAQNGTYAGTPVNPTFVNLSRTAMH
jgi:hypothetical protein